MGDADIVFVMRNFTVVSIMTAVEKRLYAPTPGKQKASIHSTQLRLQENAEMK